MTLDDWYKSGWLKRHQTSAEEIHDLLRMVDRDLRDASVSEISPDWQFGIAYDAALKLSHDRSFLRRLSCSEGSASITGLFRP